MAQERPKKLGPVSDQERAEYWPRLGSDRRRGCPTQKTAEAVWALLAESGLPVQIDELLPRRRRPPTPEEHARAVGVAKQSVLVAIDSAIDAGDRGKMLTVVRLLDALAGRWSLHGIHAAYENFCLCSLKPEYAQHPNWQHGFSVVHVAPSGAFSVQPIPILGRRTFFFGSQQRAVA